MTYEVVLDNAKMLANCFDLAPYFVDKYVTRARLDRTSPSDPTGTSAVINIGPATSLDIDFYDFMLGINTSSFLHVLDIDGVTQPNPSYIPGMIEDGYALVRVQPWVEGYAPGTLPSGTPYLMGDINGSSSVTFNSADWIGYPGQRMFGSDDLLSRYIPSGSYEGIGMHYLHMLPVDSSTVHLVVTHFGFRFYFEPV